MLQVGAVILYTYVFYMLSPPQDSVQENLGSVLASSSTSFENPDSLKVSLLESGDGNVDHPQFLKVDWYTPARKVGTYKVSERIEIYDAVLCIIMI